MRLKKQVLNQKEKGSLRLPKKKEINRICITADQLEAYLQLAYEECGDVEQVMEYMHDPELVISLPPGRQHLRDLAAQIYTHSQALQFTEKKIYFDEYGFTVEVLITATPF